MPTVSVQITRIVDDNFPGFVECILVDAHGTAHTFIEKVPIVSSDSLSTASIFPCSGGIPCEISKECQDETDRPLVKVCTERSCGVESTSGETRFTVRSSQLGDHATNAS